MNRLSHWLSVRLAKRRVENARRAEEERQNPILKEMRYGVAYIGGAFHLCVLSMLLIAWILYAVATIPRPATPPAATPMIVYVDRAVPHPVPVREGR